MDSVRSLTVIPEDQTTASNQTSFQPNSTTRMGGVSPRDGERL